MNKVSVVLPIYINKQSNINDTMRCIELLKLKTKVPFELVIIETCSQYFIDYADVYIYEKEKTNPNKSINKTFRCCNTDYIVFIGNDVFVDDNWLECLFECFEKEDCGLASLGNNEHNDIKQDKIIEKEYFSLCMIKREDAELDPFYTYIFDDTDLMFKIHISGRKMYKNLKSIIFHKPHSTYGELCGDPVEFIRSREYFTEKYKQYKDDKYYQLFSGLNETINNNS